MGRKVYEVVGYAYGGSMYCPEHASETDQPIFLGDCDPSDWCEVCLHEWVVSKTDYDPEEPPCWVFLDGEGPDRSVTEDDAYDD
jgi:hypothetical protein